MGGGRQAWCPRCDEVRAARAGASCPVCGRQLLAMPPARCQPRPGRGEQVARRLRALAPAAVAVGVACLLLVVVASAFAAGRLTRTTPSAPAAASVTTAPGFLDEGPETGRREFGWEARDSELTVELRSLTAGTGFRLELHVDGSGEAARSAPLRASRSAKTTAATCCWAARWPDRHRVQRPAPGGGIDTEVVLDRPLDVQDVALVELRGLTVARGVQERIGGALVDPELSGRATDNRDDTPWLATRRGCPGCQLRVACEDCTSVRVTGSAYRRGRVMIAVEALDRVERPPSTPRGGGCWSRRRRLSELPAWIDGSGGSAVISLAADLLAAARYGDPSGDDPMTFNVVIQAQAEEVVRGSWTITSAVK